MSENDFSFRKALLSDVNQLETIRKKSIQHCSIYTKDQLRIWSESIPNWSDLVDDTHVCLSAGIPIGFIVATPTLLDYLYIDPDYHGRGIANQLVSMVETDGMLCDCNPYSEKVLIRRGWFFRSNNVKEKNGETFHNKWYIYHKQA